MGYLESWIFYLYVCWNISRLLENFEHSRSGLLLKAVADLPRLSSETLLEMHSVGVNILQSQCCRKNNEQSVNIDTCVLYGNWKAQKSLSPKVMAIVYCS